MVPAFDTENPQDREDFNAMSEGRVGLLVLIGTASIAAAVALLAALSEGFGLGPRVPAIGYLLVAYSAVMILVNYMITLIRNETHAGLYMTAFWFLAIMVLLAVFKLFG